MRDGNHFFATKNLLFEKESYAIRGAIFEVYHQLGPGFLEAVYQECLEREFIARGLPFVSQPLLSLSYKGEKLNQVYKPDFLCFDNIIIELKALSNVTGEHQAQLLNYLKAGNKKLGLLVNFGSPDKVTIDRFVL